MRINADGTLDNTFSNSLAGYCLFPVPSKVTGGSSLGGSYRQNNPARLNSDGSADPTFVCNMAGYTWVYSIALQPDGSALIGGSFNTINGVTRPNSGPADADGSVDNSFLTGMSGPSQWTLAGSILLQNDRKILIGSPFDYVNGVVRKGLARLNTDGSLRRLLFTGNGRPGPGWHDPGPGQRRQYPRCRPLQQLQWCPERNALSGFTPTVPLILHLAMAKPDRMTRCHRSLSPARRQNPDCREIHGS